MPLADSCLPISTDWDSIEDSPGSVDPLGTLGGAEGRCSRGLSLSSTLWLVGISSKNDWIAGAKLVEDLLPLKKRGAKSFNPDGWLGKAYTEVRARNRAKSAAGERCIPHLERSQRQPNALWDTSAK
jgi:hypothetical protein